MMTDEREQAWRDAYPDGGAEEAWMHGLRDWSLNLAEYTRAVWEYGRKAGWDAAREVTDAMVEAGSRAYIVALGGDGTWGELSEETRDGERRFMRAALTAALQGGNDAD